MTKPLYIIVRKTDSPIFEMQNIKTPVLDVRVASELGPKATYDKAFSIADADSEAQKAKAFDLLVKLIEEAQA